MLYYKRKTASLGINNRQCNKSTRDVFFLFCVILMHPLPRLQERNEDKRHEIEFDLKEQKGDN